MDAGTAAATAGSRPDNCTLTTDVSRDHIEIIVHLELEAFEQITRMLFFEMVGEKKVYNDLLEW